MYVNTFNCKFRSQNIIIYVVMNFHYSLYLLNVEVYCKTNV